MNVICTGWYWLDDHESSTANGGDLVNCKTFVNEWFSKSLLNHLRSTTTKSRPTLISVLKHIFHFNLENRSTKSWLGQRQHCRCWRVGAVPHKVCITKAVVSCPTRLSSYFNIPRTEKYGIVMCYQSRVEFCHDRRHRQSSEICASCVNFSRKQRAFLQNSHRSTRFTLRNCDFILNLLKFHTLNFLAQKYGCVNFMTNLMSNRQLNQYNHPNQCYSFPSIYLSRSEILL